MEEPYTNSTCSTTSHVILKRSSRPNQRTGFHAHMCSGSCSELEKVVKRSFRTLNSASPTPCPSLQGQGLADPYHSSHSSPQRGGLDGPARYDKQRRLLLQVIWHAAPLSPPLKSSILKAWNNPRARACSLSTIHDPWYAPVLPAYAGPARLSCLEIMCSLLTISDIF